MFNEHPPNGRAALVALRGKCYHCNFTGEENKASIREKFSNASRSQVLNSLEINENHPNENKRLQVLLLWGVCFGFLRCLHGSHLETLWRILL